MVTGYWRRSHRRGWRLRRWIDLQQGGGEKNDAIPFSTVWQAVKIRRRDESIARRFAAFINRALGLSENLGRHERILRRQSRR
jgi:hypothetical protein